MGEAVPLVVEGAVPQAVCAGEVDDHSARGRLEGRRPLVIEADEHEVGAARQGFLVRHEGGSAACAVAGEAGVERARGLPGERVGAEREQIELRMGKHAVERLLPGVARRADYRSICHVVAYYAANA